MKKNIILAVAAVMLMPAAAFATGTGATGGNYVSLIMLVALFAIMYFVMIRPQQKKDKELKAMRDALKVGDEVVTIGGIYGRIIKVKEDRVTLACGAALTKIEFAKWAISGPASGEKTTAKAETKAEETEESKKPSPKTIKKLGAKTEAPAEEAAETTEAAQE